jgi:hypothetical protein
MGVIKKGIRGSTAQFSFLLQWVRMVMSIVYNDLCPIDRQSASGVSRREKKVNFFFGSILYVYFQSLTCIFASGHRKVI